MVTDRKFAPLRSPLGGFNVSPCSLKPCFCGMFSTWRLCGFLCDIRSEWRLSVNCCFLPLGWLLVSHAGVASRVGKPCFSRKFVVWVHSCCRSVLMGVYERLFSLSLQLVDDGRWQKGGE